MIILSHSRKDNFNKNRGHVLTLVILLFRLCEASPVVRETVVTLYAAPSPPGENGSTV